MSQKAKELEDKFNQEKLLEKDHKEVKLSQIPGAINNDQTINALNSNQVDEMEQHLLTGGGSERNYNNQLQSTSTILAEKQSSV